MPDVIADAGLLTRALTSLAATAMDRSTAGTTPTMTATVMPDSLAIDVSDHGGGHTATPILPRTGAPGQQRSPAVSSTGHGPP